MQCFCLDWIIYGTKIKFNNKKKKKTNLWPKASQGPESGSKLQELGSRKKKEIVNLLLLMYIIVLHQRR